MNTTRTKSMYMGAGLVVLGIAAVVLFFVFKNPTPRVPGGSGSVAPTVDSRKPSVSGQLVDPEIAGRAPIVAMVENHPDARPQMGLSRAEVVYETVAEGGITRYAALFQQPLELVGPVRSARDYFADIANGFGGVYAHVGGSPEVLTRLSQGVYKNIIDLNEFSQGQYFFRDPKRVAPHNAYARMELITQDIVAKASHAAAAPFQFSSELKELSGEAALNISVDFSLPSYKVRFAYDAGTRTYARSVAGKPDVDALGSTVLAPRTVVVELVSVTPVPGDEKLRVDIGVVGSGTVYFFRQGKVTTGTWSRQRGKAAVYADSTGAPIVFEPGQVWITGVPADGADRVTWSALSE